MIKQTEYINTKEALEMMRKSKLSGFIPNLDTLIRWVKKNNLGFKFEGRWQIDKIKFQQFLRMTNGTTKKGGRI